MKINRTEHTVITTDATEEQCVCDEFYTDNNCSAYTGPCDPTCLNGCHGPLPSDCRTCVQHAFRDTQGICVCVGKYTGDDCSIPGIDCHDSCEECYGTEFHQCSSCKEGQILTRVYLPAELSWIGINKPIGYDELDGVYSV